MTKSVFPNFSIIIPNFNGEKFISPCLLALKDAIANCPSSQFEVILVDNGSTDNSIFISKKILQSLKIIRLQSNCGFATAVNRGLNSAKYSYVCILNNDLSLDKKWFKLISKAINDHPQTTTFCGTVLSFDGQKIESQGLRYFMSGRCENINNNIPFNYSLVTSHSSLVWGSSAAVVVYRQADIIKVGLFDESFFAYIEDVDLSFRLHQLGYSTLLIPQATSRHLGGTTSSQMGTLRQYYTVRNWIRLILKNYTLTEIIINFPGILIERLRNLSYLLKSSLKYSTFKN